MDATEQKAIEIKPLAETEAPAEPPKKKRGRKPLPPEMRKNAPKTNEKHVQTPARKRAIMKAQITRLENLKKKKAAAQAAIEAEKVKIETPASDVIRTDAPAPASEKSENSVLEKIGALENTISSINSQLTKLILSGTFKEHSQSSQNNPQEPTELRQPKIDSPDESYVRSSNGGQQVAKVAPDRENYSAMPTRIQYTYDPTSNIMYW